MLDKAQKTIAADIGVKQETVSKWERGTMHIPEKRINALAQSLECDPIDFRELSIVDLVAKVAGNSLPFEKIEKRHFKFKR